MTGTEQTSTRRVCRESKRARGRGSSPRLSKRKTSPTDDPNIRKRSSKHLRKLSDYSLAQTPKAQPSSSSSSDFFQPNLHLLSSPSFTPTLSTLPPLMHPPLHKPTNETGSSSPNLPASLLFSTLTNSRTEGIEADLFLSVSILVSFVGSACYEVIKNLEICHNEWKKYFGGCNQFKIDLNMCLRGEVSSFREFNEGGEGRRRRCGWFLRLDRDREIKRGGKATVQE